MSYDIYFRGKKCETCGHHGDDGGWDLPQPTYNLTPIFDLALTGEPLPNPEVGEIAVVLFKEATDRPRGLRLLNGRKGADTIVALRKACGHLENPEMRAKFQALEPPNGWGTLKDAIYVMNKLLSAAEASPDFIWEIR